MDEKSDSGKTHFSKKYLLMAVFVLIIFVFLFLGKELITFILNLEQRTSDVCGDGTIHDDCSLVKPYGCVMGKLFSFPEICGCPEGFVLEEDYCFSKYQTEPKEITLKYVLKGEEETLNFTVYRGVVDYLSSIPRSIIYSEGENVSRLDFKMKIIDEEEQKKFLLPLVIKIQNLTNNKNDQMRIAVSIVQNIPFGNSNKTFNFGSAELNYSRYPYEVLYDMEGVCGEKTELLAFLLRELGYGISFFYYMDENHEALGVKCPLWKSLGRSGYCFVETSGPAILSDDEIEYVNVGKLYSEPEMYVISEGSSLGRFLYEYSDANKLQRIRNSIERNAKLSYFKQVSFEKLKEKYGLAEIYYSG